MKNIKIAMFATFIVVTIVVMWQLGFIEFVSDINRMQSYIKSLGYLGYLFYILIYIIVAVFSFPASIVTIVAGLVFGPVKGAIVALVGATIGAIVSFFIARYIARDAIVSKFGNNRIFLKIEEGFARNGRDYLILTRLVPIFPFSLQNYAYGISNIKTSTYIITTVICLVPIVFIFAYMAGEIATKEIYPMLFVKFVIAGFFLFGVAQIPKIITKKRGYKN